MLVIGSFEHSLDLEEVLAMLEYGGIPRIQILVVAMDTDPRPAGQYYGNIPDRLTKGVEVGMACATASSVAGTAAGFSLAWGPIFWGLFAALLGLLVGMGVFLLRNKRERPQPEILPEVTVIVECSQELAGTVIETMWRYSVISVGRVPEPS